jgi:hypothetical protein
MPRMSDSRYSLRESDAPPAVMDRHLPSSENVSIPPLPVLVTAWVLIWWLLSFVDSALPQLQMAVLNNRVVIPAFALDALFLLALGAAILRRGWWPMPSGIVATWLLLGSSLFVEMIFLEARIGGVIGSLLTTYYRFYFYLLTLPLAGALAGSIPAPRIETLLLWLFVPLGGLGLYQFFGSDAVLPTSTADNSWQVFAWGLGDDIRAFSLFNSGWAFGHFTVFICVLAFFMWQLGRLPGWLGIALCAAAALCTYASLTRTAYVVGAAAFVTAVWLYRARSTRLGLVIAAPLLWAFVGYLVASGIKDVVHMLGLAGDDGVFSSGSLDIRHEAWDYWLNVWFGNGLSSALFGDAVVQHDSGRLMSESTVLIDNVFIAVGVQVGLVGVVVWIAVMWAVWLFLLREAVRRDDALGWAIAAVWATWPLSLMFGLGGNYYGLLALLAVMTRTPEDALGLATLDDETATFELPEQGFADDAMAGHADMGIVRQE